MQAAPLWQQPPNSTYARSQEARAVRGAVGPRARRRLKSGVQREAWRLKPEAWKPPRAHHRISPRPRNEIARARSG